MAIAGFETPPFKTGTEPGIPVQYQYWKEPRQWVDMLAETIERLVKADDVPPSDIMVLTPGSSERETLKALQRIADQPVIDCSPTPKVEERGIKVATIHAFKGLESPVVVIPGIDRELEDWDPSLLYVGMSRARSLLILIVHEKAHAALERRIRTARQQARERPPG